MGFRWVTGYISDEIILKFLSRGDVVLIRNDKHLIELILKMAKEITSIVDATNRCVKVGDTVAFMESRGSHGGSDIEVAKVVGFTPKKIRLQYTRYSWHGQGSDTITKYPHQCTRIDYSPEDLILALKFGSGE